MALDQLIGFGQRERVPTRVFGDAAACSQAVAGEIAELIRKRADRGETCVLGLATGATPVGVYDELVRLHREEGLSFQNVVTFNLDEYYPIEPESLQSYVRFMHEHLFDHIDIPRDHIHIPDGTIALEEANDYCARYEQQIRDAGGLDLQLLGIGRTGHIGFNEPGSTRQTRTRMITLDQLTRADAARDFGGLDQVPRRAITMGVGTILDARRVILMAFGEKKAPIIARAVEGEITSAVPASFLQTHEEAEIFLDEAAAEGLARSRSPWEVRDVQWDAAMSRKAVIWLAEQTGKAVLKLTDEDYNENGLQSLIAAHGPAYDINLETFRALQETITGWPGGKPGRAAPSGTARRAGDEVFPKRALIFSPHPDDDVISMAGTLMRLIQQGHAVHVAYQTTGNLAVRDEDAIRYADFTSEFNRLFGIDHERSDALDAHVEQFLKSKQTGQVDSEEVQQLKTLIRRGEARAAARYCGLPLENQHFLDMPFYNTGRAWKRPLSDEDVALVERALTDVQPHQVYLAGDLSDPHGTHRICLDAILRAIERVKTEAWFAGCRMWLYRGAWQEWEPEQIDMAVPLSPQELERKRTAIFKHESQKDHALFPGTDPREFWQRAEQRNRHTAQRYDQLGLAEYEAIEAFAELTLAEVDRHLTHHVEAGAASGA